MAHVAVRLPLPVHARPRSTPAIAWGDERISTPAGHTGRRIDEHVFDLSLPHLDGFWFNIERPHEHYVVEGVVIKRTDARGEARFTMHWDTQRQRWQWGPRGRLCLEWLTPDRIAWTSGFVGGRVWHWQRCSDTPSCLPPPPPRHAESVIEQRDNGPRRVSVRLSSVRGFHGPAGGNFHLESSHNNESADARWRHGPRVPHALSSSTPGRPHRDGHRHRSRSRSCRGERRTGHTEQRYRESRHGRRSHGSRGTNRVLSCGLTEQEVADLLTRELGPEDYELLSRLDASVEKKNVASSECVGALPLACPQEFMDEECTVCLTEFHADDTVVTLPCQHRFHKACASRWLLECKHACPLCGVEVR